MKNFSHKVNCYQESVQVYVEPPLIPLIRSEIDEKSDKYSVKIELRRYPTSQKLDYYEFKMAFFLPRWYRGVLVVHQEFQHDSQCVRNAFVYCKYSIPPYPGRLRRDMSFWHVVFWDMRYYRIKSEVYYFWCGYLLSPVNALSKQNCAMRPGMRKLVLPAMVLWLDGKLLRTKVLIVALLGSSPCLKCQLWHL